MRGLKCGRYSRWTWLIKTTWLTLLALMVVTLFRVAPFQDPLRDSTSAASSHSQLPHTVGATEEVATPLFRLWTDRTMHQPPQTSRRDGTISHCFEWRETRGCDPNGPDRPFAALPCDRLVPPSHQHSGYCLCRYGQRFLLPCDEAAVHHRKTCNEWCEGQIR